MSRRTETTINETKVVTIRSDIPHSPSVSSGKHSEEISKLNSKIEELAGTIKAIQTERENLNTKSRNFENILLDSKDKNIMENFSNLIIQLTKREIKLEEQTSELLNELSQIKNLKEELEKIQFEQEGITYLSISSYNILSM